MFVGYWCHMLTLVLLWPRRELLFGGNMYLPETNKGVSRNVLSLSTQVYGSIAIATSCLIMWPSDEAELLNSSPRCTFAEKLMLLRICFWFSGGHYPKRMWTMGGGGDSHPMIITRELTLACSCPHQLMGQRFEGHPLNRTKVLAGVWLTV